MTQSLFSVRSAQRIRGGMMAATLAFGIAAAPATPLVVAPVAAAHDAVVGGSPADGDVVQEFPRTLTLDFSGEVQEGFNTFALSRSDTGEVLFTGEPTVDGRAVSIDLPADIAAEPGDYRIGFQIVSSDGHATKGMTSFTFAPAESEEGQPAPAQEPSSKANADAATDTSADEDQATSGPNTTLIWVAAGVLLIAGVAAVAVARNRQNRKLTDSAEITTSGEL